MMITLWCQCIKVLLLFTEAHRLHLPAPIFYASLSVFPLPLLRDGVTAANIVFLVTCI